MTVLCEVVRTVKLSKKRYYKVAVIHFNYNPVFFFNLSTIQTCTTYIHVCKKCVQIGEKSEQN